MTTITALDAALAPVPTAALITLPLPVIDNSDTEVDAVLPGTFIERSLLERLGDKETDEE